MISNHWLQWEKQEQKRRKTYEQQASWIELNNLYLRIERGEITLTVTTANELRLLLCYAYDKDDPMAEYWQQQFDKLSNWHNV